MVYIYKKNVGEKNYYYLRASLSKEGKQLTKDIAYLGTDPAQIREKLSTLSSEHQKSIRKTYKTIHRFLEINYYSEQVSELKLKKDPYLSKEQHTAIEACTLHWHKAFKELDTQSQEELLHDFVIDFSYNTTSLEGNTITLKEAEHLLQEERTPKNKSMREVYDLQNTKKVFFEVYEQPSQVLSHEKIIDIHTKLLHGIDQRVGYRTQDIRVTKSRFSSSPAQYVQTDMDLLLQWYFTWKTKLHPFVLAVLFHHKFENIHPFFDGNGRTGRMIMNSILLQHKYPPVMLRKKRRKAYLDALSKADGADLNSTTPADYAGLIAFIAEEYTTCYWAVFL